jgi:membrane protein YdbS with pleckstrin-like domain
MNDVKGSPNAGGEAAGRRPGSPESGGSNDAAPGLQKPGNEGPAVGPETPLWQGRGDWRYQIGAIALFFVVAIAVLILVAFIINQPDKRVYWWAGGLVVLAFAVRAGWILFVHMFGTRYRLTSQRLFIDHGILSRTTDQVELIRVDDVRIRQRLLDRMFGIGSVDVLSTDVSDAKTAIVGIADPDRVAEHIRSHMRKLRQKSLYIENL